jgi:hypothetical protein
MSWHIGDVVRLARRADVPQGVVTMRSAAVAHRPPPLPWLKDYELDRG